MRNNESNAVSLFEHFKTANSTSYLGKAYFFQIRERLIKKNAVFVGYDILIDRKYFKNQWVTKKHLLKAYIWSGEIFHVPVNKPMVGFKIRKTIHNIIHKPVDLQTAYLSLLVLIKVFNPEKLVELTTINYTASKIWVKQRGLIEAEANKIIHDHKVELIIKNKKQHSNRALSFMVT